MPETVLALLERSRILHRAPIPFAIHCVQHGEVERPGEVDFNRYWLEYTPTLDPQGTFGLDIYISCQDGLDPRYFERR